MSSLTPTNDTNEDEPATGRRIRVLWLVKGLGPVLQVSPAIGADRIMARPQVVADVQGGAVAVWLERPRDSSSWTIMANRIAPR